MRLGLGIGLDVTRRRAPDGWVDPLLSVPADRYWYGGRDNNPASAGLYSDTACTTTISSASVAVSGIKYGSVINATMTSGARPFAHQTTDGTWLLRFDGISQYMDLLLTRGGVATYTVLMRSISTPTWLAAWSPIEGLSPVGNYWGNFNGSGSNWRINTPAGNLGPTSVRKNGVALTSPFTCAPINGWMVLTVVTANATSSARYLGRTGTNTFGNWECGGFFLHPSTPNAGDVTTVENAFIARIPV